MRKIYEIDSIKLYADTGIYAVLRHSAFTRRPNTPTQHTHDQWIGAALSPAQFRFIEDKNATFRPHPRHSPTVEVFIDEHTLTERDWTIIRLLF